VTNLDIMQKCTYVPSLNVQEVEMYFTKKKIYIYKKKQNQILHFSTCQTT